MEEKEKVKYAVISNKKAMEIIKTKCSDTYDSKTKFFRGSDKVWPAFTVDPTAVPRHSRIMSDIIMLLIDHLPSWEGYPKRSLSLSMYNSENQTGGFGKFLYRVYPYNGAKLAVCPKGDFNQGAFEKGLGHVGETRLFYYLQDLWEDVFGIRGTIRDWNALQKLIFLSDKKKSGIEQFLKSKNSETDKAVYEFFSDQIKWMGNNKNFMEAFDEALDPKRNGFKMVTVGKEIPGFKEIWTESKCVLIKEGSAEPYGVRNVLR